MNALTDLKTPDGIAALAAENAQLDMVSVKCFCSKDYGHYISCFIDTGRPAAPFIAKALGGDVVGDTLVTFVIAIPPDFRCNGRDGNHVVRNGRCLCRQGYSRPNPKFAR